MAHSAFSAVLEANASPEQRALEEVIRKLGSARALAEAIGVGPTAITNWRDRGGVPLARVQQVAEVTGLPPEVIRPDHYTKREPRSEPVKPSTSEPSTELHVALATARQLGLEPEKILAKAVADERARRWQDENRAAIEAHDRWIEENGLPYADRHVLP